MIPDSPIVSSEISLRDFADELVLLKGNWHCSIATDTVGRLIGAIAADDLKSVPHELWSQTRVKDLLKPVGRAAIVPSTQPLLEILQQLDRQQRSKFWVTAEDGGVLGLLRKAFIRQLLQSKLQLDLARRVDKERTSARYNSSGRHTTHYIAPDRATEGFLY